MKELVGRVANTKIHGTNFSCAAEKNSDHEEEGEEMKEGAHQRGCRYPTLLVLTSHCLGLSWGSSD